MPRSFNGARSYIRDRVLREFFGGYAIDREDERRKADNLQRFLERKAAQDQRSGSCPAWLDAACKVFIVVALIASAFLVVTQ